MLTLSCALVVGAAFAGQDAAVRPAGAVAAAMRNPGLALLIAAVNDLPAPVVASVFGYTLGLALIVTVFVVWRGTGAPQGREPAPRRSHSDGTSLRG